MPEHDLKLHVEIPHNSSHDGTVPSMWGIFNPPGKKYHLVCQKCQCTISVDFPRYDKILDKSREIDKVLEGQYRCPSCIGNKFIEITEEQLQKIL